MSYIKPENVTSPKDYIANIEVIYDGGENGCSIARFLWDGNLSIGIRWNGNAENPKGYPLSSGHPVWTLLDDDALKVITAYKLGLLPQVD